VSREKTTIIGVDQGTTNTKVMALDSRGRILAEATRPIATKAPRAGWVEQDPEQMAANVIDCVREVLERTGRAARDVAGVGIANQTETLVVWDSGTGRPAMPAIVWQCRRGEGEIAALRDARTRSLIRSRTGLDLDPTFTAAKLSWLVRNRPVIRDGLRQGDLLWGTVDSWLIWTLTKGAVYATDAGNASRTMLFDIRRLEWDAELFELFQVEPSGHPEVRRSTGPFGVTDETIFGAPIAITGALGDQQASLFGHGCFARSDVKATYGTGAFVWLNLGADPDAPAPDGLLKTVAWLLEEPCYALEGFVMAAGAVLDWLAERLGIAEGAPGIVERATIAGSADGTILVPAFQGLASPWWRPEARAGLLGLTRATTTGQICHAGLDAICFQIRSVIEAMAGSGGHQIRALRVDGGASRSDYLMHLQADILQVPLVRSRIDSLTGYGAALMAGLGSGIWSGPEDLADLTRPVGTVDPDPSGKQDWDLAYRDWAAAIAAVLALHPTGSRRAFPTGPSDDR
jgi:glycerol kinase